MKNVVPLVDFFDHAGELLAGHRGDKPNVVGNEIICDFLVYIQCIPPDRRLASAVAMNMHSAGGMADDARSG